MIGSLHGAIADALQEFLAGVSGAKPHGLDDQSQLRHGCLDESITPRELLECFSHRRDASSHVLHGRRGAAPFADLLRQRLKI
jgi:hypothetical protein